MSRILWVPQHQPSQDQLDELDGEIVYLSGFAPALYKRLSNMRPDEIEELVGALDHAVRLSEAEIVVLPIGSPAFQLMLGYGLAMANMAAVANGDLKWAAHGLGQVELKFAHSVRESVDEVQEDGSVVKRSVFRHVGFFNPLKGVS